MLWAARGNHVDTVRLLIRRGADLRLENDKGSTPLYWTILRLCRLPSILFLTIGLVSSGLALGLGLHLCGLVGITGARRRSTGLFATASLSSSVFCWTRCLPTVYVFDEKNELI